MATRLAVNKFGNLDIGGVQVTIHLGSDLLILDALAIVYAQEWLANKILPTWRPKPLPISNFSADAFLEVTTPNPEICPFRKGAEGLCAFSIAKRP